MGDDMAVKTMIGVSVPAGRLHLRVAWLCGAVLFLEGYDIVSVGYAVPSLVDVWKIHPQAFTPVLAAGNVGLLVGSLFAGLLGDRLGRKPVLIGFQPGWASAAAFPSLLHSPQTLLLRRPADGWSSWRAWASEPALLWGDYWQAVL